MARQVLPIVGAIAGGLIAGPTGAQVGFALGSLIGNAVDPLEVQGNKVGDNPLQTASEGGARAIVFGKGCIRSTCILERGNRIVRKQRDQSGKGGGPVTINERVFWTFAIGLGEDLIGGAILRIWEGEKLVYDVTPGSVIPQETAEFAEKFRFYDGSETQLPDPDLETIHGVGEAPYYRGTAYVVFPNFDLTDYREAIPVYRWEVATATEILSSRALMLLDIDLGNTTAISSPDGQDWSEAPYPPGTIPNGVANLIAGPNVIIGHTSGSSIKPKWSEDNGLTWTESTGPTVTPRGRGCYVAGDSPAFYIPSDQGTIVLADDGSSFSILPGTTNAKSFIAAGSNIISTTGNNEGSHLLVLSGGVFVDHGVTKGSAFSGAGDDVASDGTVVRYGGTLSGTPKIHQTLDATSKVELALPSLSGSIITGLAFGELPDGQRVWIAGTDAGEILRDVGEGFELCGWSVTGYAGPIAFVGTGFVVAASGGGMYDGYVEFTVDGTSSTTPPMSYNGFIRDIASYPIKIEQIGNTVPLSDVIAAFHERCGHTLADYDVGGMTDMVSGVVIEQAITGAEAINSIIGSYVTDPSEYDGKIHYVRRGADVQLTLTYDDLVDEPDTTQRQNPIEYPRKLHYFFQSSITAYAATKATSSRSSPDLNTVKGEVSVASPITYDDADEPAQIAAMLHKINWTDAEGEIVWEITDEHIDLVPTDCVGLSLRGRVTRARITNIEDSPGVRKLTMRVDRQSAYTSDVTGIPLPTPTPPQSSILSPTVNAYMDIPALLDSHDIASPVYYDGMSGMTDVWPGAVLQRSLDGGSSWTNVTATTLNAIMGVLQNTVSDASKFYTDTTNQVVVRLYMDDEIEGISNTAFKSEGGAFVLSWETSEGRQWEVMQYRDAQQDSNGDWVLTTLHRGRLDTETAEHPPGSTFVLLDTAIRMVTAQTAWIDTDLTHRAVTNGLSPESATVETEAYTARSQTEWPVAHLFLEQDSAGDTTATVVPRHRFGTSLNPIVSNNWRGYRWTVTDGSNTITREGTSEVEVFDTSGWGAVTVTVSQLNRLTGAGPSVSETIP